MEGLARLIFHAIALEQEGYNVLFADDTTHAEQRLFNFAEILASESRQAVNQVLQAIGIANVNGPCPDLCRPFFESLIYTTLSVPVYYLGIRTGDIYSG